MPHSAEELSAEDDKSCDKIIIPQCELLAALVENFQLRDVVSNHWQTRTIQTVDLSRPDT